MLYIIRGIPGSGKSTLAEKIVDYKRSVLVPAIHLEADMYFYRLDNTYRFDASLLGAAHKWCQDNTKEHLLNNVEVVVSNTFTTMREVKPYIEMANSLGKDYKIIRMSNVYESIHNVPQEAIERMKNRFVDIEGEVYSEDYRF